MKEQILDKNNIYKVFNDITLKNEIVIFGSTYTAKFPFYELSKKYYLNNAIYNRSIEGMTIFEAEQILDDCVLAVEPSKIFLSLGECDIDDISSLEIYEKILLRIKNALPNTAIYVLPVHITDTDDKFNEILNSICQKTDIEYIKLNYNNSYDKIFRQLCVFFRSRNIDFCEAFQIL